MDLTFGTLLGGRVRYAQPRSGYRTGIEPVLMAAAVPAQAGDRVLELGTGAGAGLLCLLSRVAGVDGTGVEIDAGLAETARRNAAANGFAITVHEGDVSAAPGFGPFDHAFANPPWHNAASTRPPDERRAAATHIVTAGLLEWVAALSAALRPSGTATLALPAAMADWACSMLADAGLGHVAVVPLWPRDGSAAKLAIVQARAGVRQGHAAHGLVLHDGQGYTPEAEAILRHGAALPIQFNCG